VVSVALTGRAAYFEYPETSEIFASKDVAKVFPQKTNDNSNVPCVLLGVQLANAERLCRFAQGFQPLCAPFTRIYAIFEGTHSMLSVAACLLMRPTDYAGEFVWHCHIIEHEDSDMMRPFTTCLSANNGGDASCSNAPTRCRALLSDGTVNPSWCPSQAITYNVSNGFVQATCPA